MSVLIVLEGGEGSGKSSQSRILADALKARGIDVVHTREPGGSPGAEAIRNLVITGDVDRWSPLSEIMLFAAARVDHIERVIAPALKAGTIVICDRFVDSTIAYQGNGDEEREGLIRDLHRMVCRNMKPHLTFLMDVDPAIGLARSGKRLAAEGSNESRFEGKELAFHERIRHSFRVSAAGDPTRYHVIDATRAPADISQDILEIVLQLVHEAKAA